jgi:hypothetical protein
VHGQPDPVVSSASRESFTHHRTHQKPAECFIRALFRESFMSQRPSRRHTMIMGPGKYSMSEREAQPHVKPTQADKRAQRSRT